MAHLHGHASLQLRFSHMAQAFKDASYGEGFTADIDGKGAKKAPAKRKAAEMAPEEKDFANEVRSKPVCCCCSLTRELLC